MFGMLTISVNAIYFHIQGWWDLFAAFPLGLLGPLLMSRSKEISTFLGQPLNEGVSSKLYRIYISLAAIGFLSPFGWFCVGLVFGEWDLPQLGFSTLMAFYLLKFVDYLVVIKPRCRMTHIYSILFALLGIVQFFLLTLLSRYLTIKIPEYSISMLAGYMVLLHGIWIRSVYDEKEVFIEQTHPRLYLELPYRGAYNVVVGMFFLGSLILQMTLGARLMEVKLMGLMATFLIIILAMPYVYLLRWSWSFIVKVQVDRRYRKLRQKSEKDAWEESVISKSNLARTVHGFVYTLIVLSIVAGLSSVCMFIFTWNFSYVVNAVLCLFSVYPTQSYRMGSRRTRLRDFLSLIPTAIDRRDISKLLEVMLAIYFAMVGVFLFAIWPLRTSGLESQLLHVFGVSVTNVTLLVVCLVASLVLVTSFSMQIHRAQKISMKQLNRLLLFLVWIVIVFFFVSLSLALYVLLNHLAASAILAFAIVSFFLVTYKTRQYLNKK